MGHLHSWTKALRTWGKAGMIKMKTKTSPKIMHQGWTCMLVSYTVNDSNSIYRIWNPSTNQILISQDVTWLKCMFFKTPHTDPEIHGGVNITSEARDSAVKESDDQNTCADDDNKGVLYCKKDGFDGVPQTGAKEDTKDDKNAGEAADRKGGEKHSPKQDQGE
eukprot:14050763-Ditylum_brightwellii.AAC.1